MTLTRVLEGFQDLISEELSVMTMINEICVSQKFNILPNLTIDLFSMGRYTVSFR